MTSTAATMAAFSAQQTSAQLAANMMRANADMLTQMVEMISESADRGKALVADGVGGNVDVSA